MIAIRTTKKIESAWTNQTNFFFVKKNWLELLSDSLPSTMSIRWRHIHQFKSDIHFSSTFYRLSLQFFFIYFFLSSKRQFENDSQLSEMEKDCIASYSFILINESNDLKLFKWHAMLLLLLVFVLFFVPTNSDTYWEGRRQREA